MRLPIALLLVAGGSAFIVAPPAATAHSRSTTPTMLWRGAKGIPKGKIPEKTKADDKSWGLLEFFSDIAGGSDEPDAGPKLGKASQADRFFRYDESGNWKGDRRTTPSTRKKTVNEGAKFNPFDASTW